MRKANANNYFKRADEFYTKEMVKNYSTYRQDYKIHTGNPRYHHITKVLSKISKTLPKKIKVLDLGCGEGRFFDSFKNASFILGVDASREMLAAAKRHHGKDKRIRIVRSNLLTFNTKKKFDLVFSNGVLCEHSPLTIKLLNNVYSWLNKGGYFFFTTTLPAGIKLRLMRKAGDIVAFIIKPFTRNSWIYRKLLSSYKHPKKVRKMINRTNFKILSSKIVNNKGSHVDQTFWLLKK